MKAIGYHACLPVSQPDALVDLNLPHPQPGPRDLLVAVQAVSVNPVDVKLRGNAAPTDGQARVLGFDAAGVVTAVGDKVTLFAPGDRVFYAGALNRPGSNAQFQLVDERIVGPMPQSLDFAQAAAMPLTAITAWEMLFDRLGGHDTRTDQGLLVIGGAGGVGSMMIQLARQLTGLTVIATASRPESRAWCLDMGAHHVVDHRWKLPPQLAAIGWSQVDLVASLTNSDQYLAVYPDIVAPQGRIALIDDPSGFDIMAFKRKSITVAWEFMFTRSLFQTRDMAAQHDLLAQVSRLVDAGTLRTTLATRGGPITAATLRAAHAGVESGRSIGKTVLAGFDD